MKVIFIQGEGFDYLTSQLCEGFHLSSNGKSDFRTNQAITHHGALVDDLEIYSDEDLLDMIYQGWPDVVLYSSAGNMNVFSEQVVKFLSDKDMANKRVFIDGHDGDGLLVDPTKQLLYFKREMRIPEYLSLSKYRNIRSITFGVYQYLIDSNLYRISKENLSSDYHARDIDVSFMAFGGSNPSRSVCKHILDAKCSDLKIEMHVAPDKQPIEMRDYHTTLYRSKVGISLPGAGLDTLRYWETPAHGAILCALEMPLIMRNAFEAGRHHISFCTWEQMVETIRLVVKDEDRWLRLRKAADNWIEHHSTRHRAKEVVEICGEIL